MAFTVTFYQFPKKDNSTARPASGSGTDYSCGILAPTISLDIGLTSDPSHLNYAYISVYGRYYFVEEWYFEDALWTASLRVDVLATYKTSIGNSSLYVLRSSAARNGSITDTLYPAKTGCSFSSVTKTNPWTGTSFIVGIVTDKAAMGSIKYYAMLGPRFAHMCAQLTDAANLITPENGFNLTDASQALQLSIVDPIQYIKSCIMLPVEYADLWDLGKQEYVSVFNFNLQAVIGTVVEPRTRVSKSYTFNLVKHPDTSARGNYVNSAPFTNITLTIPPFGCIDIDTSVTCNASTVIVDVDLDVITGKAILVVRSNGIVLNRIESQVGVPVSISSVTRDYIGGVTSAVGAAGAIASGNIAAGAIGAAMGVGNAIQSLTPRAQTVGTTGAFVANRGDFRLDHQFFRPVNDDNAHNGRPLCEVRTVKNLGGYMLIQDGDVSMSGTLAESRQVKEYLETGFYYE